MAATPPVCDFGWKAIDATLPGVDGKEHRLFNLAGPNGLVVAFICNHCPYVKAVIDRIVRDAADLSPLGIGFVAINSNDATSHPQDSFPEMKLFAERNGFGFPYLHDETQDVARRYDARVTPEFYGIDNNGVVLYRGRLDGGGTSPLPADSPHELVEAMRMIARNGEGPAVQHPAAGCSIKWKE